MSRCLSRRDIDHVVLERHEVASAWVRQRWDSLRLLTPNWMTRLPGADPFDGPTDGFAPASDVAAHLRNYASTIGAPVVGDCAVERIEPDASGWRVSTSARSHRRSSRRPGDRAGHDPADPARGHRALRVSPETIGALEYKNPDGVKDGGVLVVGASASGTRIRG